MVQAGRLVGARGMGQTQVDSAVWIQSHRQMIPTYLRSGSEQILQGQRVCYSFCSYLSPTPSCYKLKGKTFTQSGKGHQPEASRAWSEEKGIWKRENCLTPPTTHTHPVAWAIYWAGLIRKATCKRSSSHR